MTAADIDPDEIAIDFVLDLIGGDALARIATDLLVNGHDTLELGVAAMPDSNDPRNVRETFRAALRSIGTEVPSRELAVRRRLILLTRDTDLADDTAVGNTAGAIAEAFPATEDRDSLSSPFSDLIRESQLLEYWPESLADVRRAIEAVAACEN